MLTLPSSLVFIFHMIASQVDFRCLNSTSKKHDGKPQPAFMKYPSLQAFLDSSRADLIKFLPRSHGFRSRVVNGRRGTLREDQPNGRSRTPSETEALKARRIGKTDTEHPLFHLIRNQLVDMYNRERTTEEEIKSFEKIKPKILKLKRKYRLVETKDDADDYNRRRRTSPRTRNASKNKATEQNKKRKRDKDEFETLRSTSNRTPQADDEGEDNDSVIEEFLKNKTGNSDQHTSKRLRHNSPEPNSEPTPRLEVGSSGRNGRRKRVSARLFDNDERGDRVFSRFRHPVSLSSCNRSIEWKPDAYIEQ